MSERTRVDDEDRIEGSIAGSAVADALDLLRGPPVRPADRPLPLRFAVPTNGRTSAAAVPVPGPVDPDEGGALVRALADQREGRTTAVALGYIDFRMPEQGWRPARPRLAAWFEAFAKRPSMAATKPPSA